MRVVSVGRVEHPVTMLAAVRHRVPQMLRLNVVLQGGQAGAGLLQSAHLALVASLAKFLNPLPDQCSGILCNMGLVRWMPPNLGSYHSVALMVLRYVTASAVSRLKMFAAELASVCGLGAEVDAANVIFHRVLRDIQLGADVTLPRGCFTVPITPHLAHILAAVS